MKSFLAALACVSCIGAANAQLLEVVDSTACGSTSARTEVVGGGLRFQVGQLSLNLDPRFMAFLTYTFIGAAPGPVTAFLDAGNHFAFDNRTFVGAFATDTVRSSGLLDFSFASRNDDGFATNGSNSIAYRAHYGIHLDPGNVSGLLLFDRGVDHPHPDYDDMLVRFSVGVTPVPEPGTMALMLAGLAALVVLRRRHARTGCQSNKLNRRD